MSYRVALTAKFAILHFTFSILHSLSTESVQSPSYLPSCAGFARAKKSRM